MQQHENWIGGAWSAPRSEHFFEVASAESGRALGRFPRSAASDCADAVEAAVRAGEAWRARDRRERNEMLGAALALVAEDEELIAWIATSIGLAADEARARLSPLRDVVTSSLRDVVPSGRGREPSVPDPRSSSTPARAALDASGVHVLLPDWSELLVAPIDGWFRRLASGHTVVLVSDAPSAGAWERVARALERAGLPHGVASLVHDDTTTCLEAALLDPRAARVACSGPAWRIRAARSFARAAGADRASALDARGLRNRTHAVDPDADVELEARNVVAAAFGRVAALSGQAPDQVGRVACPVRSFSRFTEALLAAMQDAPDVARPLPIVERDTTEHARRARELGIDEGATLVAPSRPVRSHAEATRMAEGGETPSLSRASAGVAHDVGRDLDDDAETALDGRASRAGRELRIETSGVETSGNAARDASPIARGEGMLAPIVFTNVEAHMRLARLGRPAPVLALLRAEDAAHARELAGVLDSDPASEDLSLVGRYASSGRTSPAGD